jgi:pimeloyl-ACP methyl ester carboxylesterase
MRKSRGPMDDDATRAPNPWTSAALAVGRAVARASVWTADKAVYAYRAVDPDVQRHVVHGPLVGLGLLFPSAKTVEAKPDDGYRPVVFVHGMAGDPSNFYAMRAFFSVVGRRRTYAVDLSQCVDVRAMADVVAAFVREVRAVNRLTDGAKVDVVAHSQGGLATRQALLDPDLAALVGTVVTLGTPHAGTHAARYAGTVQGRDLRPEADAIARLRAQVPWNGPARLVCFWSRNDLLVLPAESAYVEGAEAVEFAGATHLSYLLDPQCWQAVWDRLRPA